MMSDRDFTSVPLFGSPEEKQPSSGERSFESAPLEFPQAAPKDWKAVGEDVGMSSATKGAKGLVGGIFGMPGTIEKFVTEDVPRGLAEGAGYVAERLDLVSPDTRKQFFSDIDKLNKQFQTPAQQKGYAASSGLPTYEGVTQEMEKAAPALKYTPKTTEGAIIGTGAEFAAQSVPGAVRSLPGRAFTGFSAGVGSEAAGKLAEDTWAEPLFKLGGLGAGAVAGGMLSNAVRAVAMPTSAGREELAKALAADFQRGKANMTLDELDSAVKNGTPVTVYDLGGPETKKVLARYAELTPQNREAVAEFNTFLNERKLEASKRTSDYLASPEVFGKPIDAVALTQAVEAAGKQTRDQIYGLVRKDPAAASIQHSGFGDILDRPIVRRAMKEAENTAANNPEFNIIAPKYKAATPSQPTGIVDEYGRPLMGEAAPAVETMGNLSYWDQVKRELQNQETMAIRSGDRVTAASAKAARDSIVKSLDDQVKGYKAARDLASETFGAANAPEAGYNFYNNMNAFKRSEIQKTYNSYTPEQKSLFAEGFAHRLKDDIERGNLTSLSNKFTKDQNFQERAQMVLGSDKYNAIKGKVLAENTIQKTKELQFIADNFGPAKVAGAGAALAGTSDFLMSVVNNAQFVPADVAIKAGVTAAGLGALKLTLNAAEKRIAERVIPMIDSQDPKVIKQLGEMATQYPAVESLLNKFSSSARNAATVLEEAQNKPQKAAGGRVGRKEGGRVEIDHEAIADGLISKLDKIHKSHQKSTEPLMKLDDNTIAKALEIAQRNI